MAYNRLCSKWKSELSDLFPCEGVVLDSGTGDYVVEGSVKSFLSNPTVLFWAPNPPNLVGAFNGSGLPYPNAEIAFDNTPNRGAVKAPGGHFKFNVQYPSAYYVGLGSVLEPPAVFIKVCDNNKEGELQRIVLGEPIPFRSLTWPPLRRGQRGRQNVLFYAGRDELPLRTQEQILRDSGYTSKDVMPDNFWGLKPPQ